VQQGGEMMDSLRTFVGLLGITFVMGVCLWGIFHDR
jgi:hypothetical protein